MPSFGFRKRRLPEGMKKLKGRKNYEVKKRLRREKSKEERGKKKELRLTTKLFH
jgi:hypothetical protein